MPMLPALIGAAGGLASAVLFYSAVRGSVGLSILLFLLTPLPSLITGFGWGLTAAVSGAVVGALLMASAVGQNFGIGYFLALGLPIIIVTHLATLVRYDGDRIAAWYPEGGILAAILLYGGALPILVTPLFGGSYQVLETDFVRFLDRIAEQAPPDSAWRMPDEQKQHLAKLWIDVMPAALAAYWTLFFAINVYLAARISRASGSLPRSDFAVSRIELPVLLAPAFLLATFAVTFSGEARIIGASFIGALFVGFLIMGFTVAHVIGQTRARWVTPAAYATAIFAGGIALPVLAGIGLGETAFRFRDRMMPPSDAPTGEPPNA